jgi:hypothetical protein
MSNVSKNLSACFIMLVLHDGGRDGLWTAIYAFHVGRANILRRLNGNIFYTIVAAFIYWQMLVVNGFKAHLTPVHLIYSCSVRPTLVLAIIVTCHQILWLAFDW